MDVLNSNIEKYIKDDIKWIVTAPTILSEPGKQLILIIKWSKETGMNDIMILKLP